MNTIKVLIVMAGLALAELALRIWQFIETILILIPFKFLLPALIGGIVDYISESKENIDKKSIKQALLRSVVSGFAGMLTYYICMDFQITEYKMAFLIGLSGFAGVRALKFFENITKAIIEKAAKLRFVDDKKDENTEIKKNDDNTNNSSNN